MNYDLLIKRNNEKRKSGISYAIKAIVIIGLIVAALHIFFPKALSSMFTSLVKPFWSIEIVNKENDELKRQLAEKEALYLQTNLLKSENDDLKNLLGRSASSTNKVLAQILKKPPFSAYDIFIIDIGSDSGIKKGDKVYALGNILIGEIAEADSNTSKVKLFSTPGEKFDVLIGKDNIAAIAIGKGGGTFEVSLPHDANVSSGDSVIIPSLTDAFVGIVGETVSEPSQPFSTILFKQPINLYQLRWVLVNRS